MKRCGLWEFLRPRFAGESARPGMGEASVTVWRAAQRKMDFANDGRRPTTTTTTTASHAGR